MTVKLFSLMAARVFDWNTQQFHAWANRLLNRTTQATCASPHHAEPQARLVVDGVMLGCTCFTFMLNEHEIPKNPTSSPDAQDYGLLLLSSRNRVTYNMLCLVVDMRRCWLIDPQPEHLMPITYREIRSAWATRWPDRYLDDSIISRVMRNTIVETHGQQISLSQIFPRRTPWLAQCLRKMIYQEEGMDSDAVLAARLGDWLGMRISPRTMQRVRQFAGIPSQRDRVGKHYGKLPLHRPLRPLSRSILSEVPDACAIYELHRSDGEECYPLGASAVLYIGASRNLRKRLYSYLNGRAHTEGLRDAIAQGVMLRHMRVDDPLQSEALLIEGFVRRYGSLPKFNRIVPRSHSGIIPFAATM